MRFTVPDLTAGRRRAVLAGAGLLLAVALVGLASLPNGAASPTAVVPDGGRIAARSTVDDTPVMLVSEGGKLRLVVAYKDDKGWFGVPVDPAPLGTPAAWAGTGGGGKVPSLSAVYGRAEGVTVTVRWADGEEETVRTARDGSYLVTRGGKVRSERVTAKAEDGSVLGEVEGP